MTAGSESRKEANSMSEVLSAKSKTRIGFWNVRTMYETGKLAQVTSEMKRYNLHILGISESRWTRPGRITTDDKETVLYSGREDNHHSEGVVLILKMGMGKKLLERKPVNSGLLTARFKGRQNNMTIIQCYAPTNDSDENSKDTFYEQLQSEIISTHSHDMLIVMGDLNTKVGNENICVERIMGKHGCGSLNNNGERPVDICALNDLVIGGTLFPHPLIHKLTWNSPNGIDRNQIDHILVNGKWRSLIDVTVHGGADMGSDHHLVIAQLKVKLQSTCKKLTSNKHFDTDKLKDQKVKNRIQKSIQKSTSCGKM